MVRSSSDTWYMGLLQKRLEDKICALWYGEWGVKEDVGSGTFLSAPPRKFILTCEHVATPFYKCIEARVHVPGGLSIPREHTTLIFANKARDLALIQVNEEASQLAGFELEGVAPIEDFTRHDFSSEHLVVCGFPAISVKVSPKRREFSPILYLTGLGPDPPSQDLVYCNYPVGPGEVIGAGPNAALPRAPGLSGSALLSVPSPSTRELPINRIWTFENMRIVGVTITWNQSTYLEGTRCGDVPSMIRGEKAYP